MLKQLERNIQRNEFGPLPHTTDKVNSKLILVLTGNANTIELLEENIGVNLCDLELSNELLHIIPKAWETKEEKKINLTWLKLKTFML